MSNYNFNGRDSSGVQFYIPQIFTLDVILILNKVLFVQRRLSRFIYHEQIYDENTREFIYLNLSTCKVQPGIFGLFKG